MLTAIKNRMTINGGGLISQLLVEHKSQFQLAALSHDVNYIFVVDVINNSIPLGALKQLNTLHIDNEHHMVSRELVP